MRRKDREMAEDFAVGLIDSSTYGVLSVIDEDGDPYGVPLSIVRQEKRLYFHSAQGGKKVDAFTNGKLVCVSFVGTNNIPELYSREELDNILSDEKKGITLASRVFTTEFESAIVFGKIHLVEELEESIVALKLICQKYTPTKIPYFDLAIKSGLSRTNVYRIDIDSITGKRKKYDSSGEEMKWGRLSE